jgi:hypothetical protein
MPIPNNFHFIFGLKPQDEPFHIAWYLCLRSCLEVNKPDRVFFHYHNEPYGKWWERIKSELELIYVEEEEFIKQNTAYQGNEEGRFIQQMKLQYAHQSDFIRLRALLEYGGVYADIDTMFVKPYPDTFFSQPCVMGRETESNESETLCNALIMAEQNSAFIKNWLARMYEVFDGTWNRHSCLEPALLSKEFSQDISVVDKEYFFDYSYTTEGLASLFGKVDLPGENVSSIHMWSHLWWDRDRTDFIRFHNAMLTEDFIRNVDTTYNLLARRFLD